MTLSYPRNMLSGTHRAAASEIRAELDGTRAYDDLEIIDVSHVLDEDLIGLWRGDPEMACEEIERRLESR